MSGETETEQSGWTVDTLNYFYRDAVISLRREISAMGDLLDERYATQTKATDKAFEAQQTAMQTALQAAEKAVDKALESAEKAVTKAELAANARFEATNEFRGQLQDQATRFVGIEVFNAEVLRLSEKVDDLKARVDKTEGRSTGVNALYVALIGSVGLVVTVVVAANAVFGK